MIDPQRLIPADTDAVPLTPASAEAALGPIDETVREFLEATANAQQVRGRFHIKGAAALAAQRLSIPVWDEHFGEQSFPGLGLGYETGGSEFIVLTSSARVISVHHDSLPELASELDTSSPEAFVAQLEARAAPLHLPALLRLHTKLDGLPDEPTLWVHTIAATLELSMEATLSLLALSGSEFLWTHCRDALELWDRKTFIAAHNLRTSLEREPKSLSRKRKLDLSVAGLVELPASIATLRGLKTIDLGDNPNLDVDAALASLAQLPKLDALSLARCNVRQLSGAIAQLPALTKLELGGNPIDTIDPHGLPASLALLDVRETGITDESQLEALRHERPTLQILFSPETKPHGLAAARRDPQGARVLDLSRRFYGNDETLTKLPSLDRFPNLKVLRLDNQVELQANEVLAACDQLELTELSIPGLGGAAQLEPLLLESFQQLETLRLDSRYELHALWPTLAALPALRELRAALSWRKSPLPPTKLQRLHLGEVASDGEPVPPGLALQTELEELSLSGYGDRLPEEIDKLDALRVLELRFNPEHEHQRFAALSGLEVLRIYAGGSIELPDLRQMPRLRELAIAPQQYAPRIGGALDTLADLSELETLVLSGHPRAALPDGLGRLPLRRLELRGDNTPVPIGPWLGELATLETLTLRKVALEAPEALGRLSTLRELDAVETVIGDAAAQALVAGPRLHRLSLRSSELTGFPVGLARQHALVELQISCGDDFDPLRNADELRGLEALEHLELSCIYNGARLPESITALPNLRRLTLDNARELDWDHVFQLIAQIPSLRELRACWATIPALPASVGEATQLESIEVHQAGVKAIDPAIAQLTRLRELQITTNPIASATVKKLRKQMPWCRIEA